MNVFFWNQSVQCRVCTTDIQIRIQKASGRIVYGSDINSIRTWWKYWWVYKCSILSKLNSNVFDVVLFSMRSMNYLFMSGSFHFSFFHFWSKRQKTKKSAFLFVYILYEKSAFCLKMTADFFHFLGHFDKKTKNGMNPKLVKPKCDNWLSLELCTSNCLYNSKK